MKALLLCALWLRFIVWLSVAPMRVLRLVYGSWDPVWCNCHKVSQRCYVLYRNFVQRILPHKDSSVEKWAISCVLILLRSVSQGVLWKKKNMISISLSFLIKIMAKSHLILFCKVWYAIYCNHFVGIELLEKSTTEVVLSALTFKKSFIIIADHFVEVRRSVWKKKMLKLKVR